MKKRISQLWLPLLGTVLLAASCMLAGCGESSVPKEKKEEPVHPAGEHSFGAWETVEATCTAKGKRERVCPCGEKETEEIPATDHEYEGYLCKFCGKEIPSSCLSYTPNGEGTCLASVDLATCTDTTVVVPAVSPDGATVTAVGYTGGSCNTATGLYLSATVRTVDPALLEAMDHLTGVTVSAQNPCFHVAGNCLIETESKTLVRGFNNSTIPTDGSVTVIGAGAFAQQKRITKLSVPSGVTSVGDGAFAYCMGLTKLTLPASIEYIGKDILAGCSALKELTVPFVGHQRRVSEKDKWQYPFGYFFGTKHFYGSIETVQYSVEDSTTGNGSKYTYYIPSTLKTVTVLGGTLKDGAFVNCTGLTDIRLTSDVTEIGNEAFAFCTGLKSLSIPHGVQRIQSDIVLGCAALESLDVPASAHFSLSSFGGDCPNLKNIYYGGTKQQWQTMTGNGYYSGLSGVTINYMR